MKHYPRHIGDYLRDTGHLTLLEHGVYSRLLDIYYAGDGPIQMDLETLSRKLSARTAEEKEAVRAILSEFFTVSEAGEYVNKRCEETLAKYRTFGEQQRARIRKRYGNSTDGIPTVTERFPTVDLPNTAEPTKPETNNHKPETNNHSIPPNPRGGGKGFDWFAALPVELDTPEFREAWLEWITYRKGIKKPFAPASAPAAFRKAVEVGVEAAIKGFETAMANGWQGAFPATTSTQATKHDHRAEKRSREFPEPEHNLIIWDDI
jgi:uncharacterized protein YdaU (DUF1376 family)